MLFSNAFAADTASTATSGFATFMNSPAPFFIMVVVVFYTLVIRPNQKRIKDHEDMIKGLRRGDKVVTAGGVIGVISKVEDDNILVLEIASEVKIRVVRDTISNVLNKTIANDNKADAKAADKSNSK